MRTRYLRPKKMQQVGPAVVAPVDKQAADTRVLVQIDWIDTWSFGIINRINLPKFSSVLFLSLVVWLG
jgi:hypothetical protein